MTTLIVGATGDLGLAVCQNLGKSGQGVRALVRATSNKDRVSALERSGVGLSVGDLKAPPTLEGALIGVDTVVSTASATVSRQDGDSIESVDLRGHLHLIEAAKRAGVKRFIYVSFYRQELDFPLQTAKRAVENELIASGFRYTIFQPVDFMETWLSPAVGFDPANGQAQVMGSGEAKTNWVSRDDVANFVVAAVGNERFSNRAFPLGGPEALSQLEVIDLFRSLGVGEIKVTHIAESTLKENFESSDPLARSFAGLMLGTARGLRASSASALEVAPMQLTTVRQFAEKILQHNPEV